MSCLVRLYAANFRTKYAILQNMGIGDSTWVAVAELEAEHDTEPFFLAVKEFYVSTIVKLLKKFHLEIYCCKIWEFYSQTRTTSYDVSRVLSCAKCFVQLCLTSANSLDPLAHVSMGLNALCDSSHKNK